MKAPRPLALDLVGRRPLASAGGWLLLVAGCLLALASALDWQEARDDTMRWQDKAERWQQALQRARHDAGMTGEDLAALRPQVEAAVKAVNRLTIPWSALYRSLESSADDSVSLLAILPNPDKGEVRLNGEAKDFAALRAYVQRLGEGGVLADVRLQNQEVRESVAERPIVFSLVAAWRTGP